MKMLETAKIPEGFGSDTATRADMDYQIQHRVGFDPSLPPHDVRYFYPSQDILHAWQVVETLRKRGIFLSIHAREGFYTCVSWNTDSKRIVTDASYGETAALVICRAALLAVMEMESK